MVPCFLHYEVKWNNLWDNITFLDLSEVSDSVHWRGGGGMKMSKYFQFMATSKLLVTYRVWNNHNFRIKLLYL